jgi:hypothetical protein
MNYLRSILTCLAIASLLVSDVVIAVHSASCSHGAVSQVEDVGQVKGPSGKHCCSHHHCGQHADAQSDGSQPSAPEHDSDQCTICRGALVCRFAVLCDAVLPPSIEGLVNLVADNEVTLALAPEFSSALSERGPPA